MKKSELKQIIKEEIRKIIKESKYGSPVLPLGKVNLLTGQCKYFNIYDTWDGTVEVWEELRAYEGSKYKLVFTSNEHISKKHGDREEFRHDQTGRQIGYWTFVDSTRVKKMKDLAPKYGKSISGYTYK